MKRILFAVFALVLGAAGSIQAQNPPQPRPIAPLPTAIGEVMGTVVDTANKEPVARASVAVRSKKDSSLVTGAITGPDGAFHIQGLRPGDYYLRTTSIGFKPRSYTFSVTDAAPRANVGSLTLTRIAVTLQSVQVAGQAPAMVIEPDRNSYRAKDVAPAAANASEVLQATPSVEVDGDGKVSLRGNENVAIQINGRPTPITGAQLAAYLKQIPANIVERIEVVPNPSAKYDPEGMAGIINIVLKAQTDLGVSGGLNAGGANINRMNAGTNLGYQAGALTLFGTYGYNADNRGIIGLNDRLSLDPSGAPKSYTNQLIDGNSSSGGHNFSTNLDYKLTDRDVLSNQFSINRRHGFDNSLAGYTDLDAQQAFVDRYDFYRNDKSRGLVFDNSLSIKRTFEARKHELSSEVRFNRTRDEDSTVLWQQPLTQAGAISGSRILGERDQTSALTRQLTAQVDYVKQLRPSTKLETGLKETSRWLDREFLVLKDSLGDGTWLRSGLSNTFNFDDHVHAGYGVLSQSVGKFDLQAGLRAQFVNRNFSLADGSGSFPYNYHSLFPSGVINYKPSDASQIKVSYSRRTRAPGTQELNPFPVFFDQQNVFLGNPRLNPEYTDAFELSTSRNGSLGSIQLSPFFKHTTDVITVDINTAAKIDGRNVTSISFQNAASANSWGTDLNGSLRLGPKLNAFGGFNLYKVVTDGGSQSVLSSNAVTWSYRLNATTQLSPTVSLQGNYFYRAPMNIARGRFSAMQMTNISLRKKIDGDNMSVAVRFVDPFDTMKFRIKAGDDNLTQITARKFGVRATFVTFQYNFGQTPKIRLPKEEPAQPAPVFP
ncbi:MAG TPA: TonB-dependent receptor [Gemmatimonadaceae bacterium]|jgi:outer membrane receptor protein involved in Fe transport|nr:TonB-dependent receptor [Gemmatimonadaceae bacterium]